MTKNTEYSNVKPEPIEQINTGGQVGAYKNVRSQEEKQNEIAQSSGGKTEEDPMDKFIDSGTSGEPSHGKDGKPEDPIKVITNFLEDVFSGNRKKNGESVNDTYQDPGKPVTEKQHGGVESSQENDESMNKALESIEGFSNNNSSTSLQPANFQSGGQKNKHPLVAGDKVGRGKLAIATEFGGNNQQGTDNMFQGGTENNLKEEENSTYDNEVFSQNELDDALRKMRGGAKRRTKRSKKSRKTRKTRKPRKSRKTRKPRKSRKSLKKKKTKGKKSSKHQRKTVRRKHKSKVHKRK